MGSKPSMPAPAPSPSSIAKKQLKYNRQTADLGANYNRLNQRDAFGNELNYQQTGTDPRTGNPTFAVSQTPGEYATQYAGGLSNLGQQYFSGATNFLANPADYSNEATEARIAELGARRLDPRFAREEDALRTRLANAGHDPRNVGPGSAYDAEMERFNQGKNDAYNQLAMNARGQAFNEALTGRQAQVGEFQNLTAPGIQAGLNRFLSPQFANVPGVNVGSAPDMASLYGQQQQDAWNRYNAEMQQRNAMMGGLGQIGGALLMAPMTGGGSLGGAIGGAAMGGLSSLGGMFGGGAQPAPSGGYGMIPRQYPMNYQGR